MKRATADQSRADLSGLIAGENVQSFKPALFRRSSSVECSTIAWLTRRQTRCTHECEWRLGISNACEYISGGMRRPVRRRGGGNPR